MTEGDSSLRGGRLSSETKRDRCGCRRRRRAFVPSENNYVAKRDGQSVGRWREHSTRKRRIRGGLASSTGPVSEKRMKANRPRLEFIYRVAYAGKSHGDDDGDI